MSAERVITVGLGEIQASRQPGDVLVAYGLGSCVGIASYDPILRAGALAHVMLPEALNGAGRQVSAKFATEAIPLILEALKKLGCSSPRLIWKMAGGAQVLAVPGMDSRMLIGERNVAMVRSVMQRLGLAIAAEDTGGRYGRTMQLFIDSGKVTVRSVGGIQREL